MLELHPEAAVPMISGYYKEAPPVANSGQMRFLKKPFSPSQSIQHLRELLLPRIFDLNTY